MLSVIALGLVLAQTPTETPEELRAPYEAGAVVPVPAPPAADADADAEKPPPPVAAYVPGEGFRIRDASGDNMLRFALQSAFKFEPRWTEGDPQLRGTLTFMRPVLRGNVFKKWLTFWISTELAGNPPYLLDAYFDVVPWEAFGVRAGQQYSPYDRQEQLGPQQLFFPEWAPVPEYFWPGRDKGVMVYGLPWEQKFAYSVGLFSGTPLRQVKTIPGNFNIQARVAFNPMGPVNATELPFTDKGEAMPTRFSIGLNTYGGTSETATENFNSSNGQLVTTPTGVRSRKVAGGGDLWFQSGSLILQADAHVRRIDNLDGSPMYTQAGAWGQAILGFWENRFGVGVQFNWLDPNTSVDSDNFMAAQAQLAWFIHAPEVVLKLRYAYLRQEAPVVAIGTLPFTVGNSHLLTLQMNLSF